MKARFLALAALVLGMVSCQQDFDGVAPVGGEVDFQLTVAAPELGATRADNDGDEQRGHDSAYGAIDYLSEEDWAKVDLRYTLEVYDVDEDGNVLGNKPVKDRMTQVVKEYTPVSFDLRLVPNRKYRFVVFADFVDAEGNGKHHVIGETLQNITVDKDGINNEYTDAYFDFEDITITNSVAHDIVLRRPYGKVRVIATDLAELNLNVEPRKVVVEYESAHVYAFNAVTGEIDATKTFETATYSYDYAEIYKSVEDGGLAKHYYTEDYDAKVENGRHTHMTLFTDYILATDQQSSIHFTMTVNDGQKDIKTTEFNTDIPVQRNHLTTIIGNVLTTATEINVTIDDNFAGNHVVEEVTVDSPESFAKALAAAATQEYASIELVGDVEWATGASHGSTPLIGADAKTEVLVINGNGRKFTATGAGVGPIRMANGGKLVFNNVVIVDKSVSYNEGAWELGYLEFAGELEFNNCEFKNAVMMCGGTPNNDTAANATFTGCKFNSGDANQYDVWVSGNKAYFNNCDVNGFRGIKLHEAYGSEVEEVVIDNCRFNSLAKKPGVALGDLNAETKVEIKNSTFTNCQAGDQGLYIYESDTDVATFNFVEQNNVVVVTVDNETIAEALKTNVSNLVLALSADAVVEVSAWNSPYYIGGANTTAVTINGNGNKLTFNHNNTDWNYVRCLNDNAVLTIENAELSNSGNNNGPWNRHDITFYNNVVLRDVTSDKAIALCSGADLTNVTISDVHVDNSDAYALWIRPNGQTVNINNCQLLAHESKKADRGIKIDEQYIDAPAKVTLNVDGLKVKSQKKAAIVVKSKAGAEINLNNVDITEVKADNVNAVWVDEASAAYADKVVVKGGSVIVEGATVVADASQLADAVKVANATVQLPAGTYTMPTNVGAGVTIVCAEGATFQGKSGLNINGATVIGATFKNEGGNAVSGTINGTFKNCAFTGSNALRGCYAGETVVFENCVFSGNTYGVHFDGGANDATFKGCAFSGFNAFGAALTQLTLEDCTFVGNGKSGYNGANLWGSTAMKNCEFTFDGTSSTEWVDCIGAGKTYSFENCTVNGVAYTADNYDTFESIFSRSNVTVTINGVDCKME